MKAIGFGAGDTLELPDGRRCLVLSFDFAFDMVRILWKENVRLNQPGRHADVDIRVLDNAVVVPKAVLELGR